MSDTTGGPGDYLDRPTIPALSAERFALGGERPALLFKRDGSFVAWSWNDLADAVQRAAAALEALGVRPGDRVAQLSENRREWLVVDLAILGCGAVHVPIHASLSGAQVAYQLADSGAHVLLVSTAEQRAKIRSELPRLDQLRHIVSFDSMQPDDPASLAAAPVDGGAPRHHSFDELLAAADPGRGRRLLETAARETTRETLATIIYTSGTTGEPKGVMLTHGNLTSNAVAVVQAFEFGEGDRRLVWLPLSHIFARTCDAYSWLVSGAELVLAEARETVIADCGATQPTFMNGVPYFYDKVMRTLMEKGVADAPGVLAHILGGRMKALCSGGAALPDHVATFYHQRGIPLVQGYGLTETSPVIAFSTPRAHRLGSVGRAPPGIEIKIAADGEVLTRGPHVMTGYWNKPDATREAIRDGWFHTGDLGRLDEEGYLTITGRKKEIIVTSGGKNVAPVFLEALLTADPLVQQALVIGDGRSFLTALIVVGAAALEDELRRKGVDVPPAARLTDERVIALYRERIDARLAHVAQFEQLGRFTLLAEPFTVDRDELTPTLKLRRGVIATRYAEQIEAMYR